MNILNKLTIKHLTMNKKRTVVTILGVILSTALMIGIGLLASSIRDYMIKEVILNTGNYHASIKNVSSTNLEKLKTYDSVKNVSYEKGLGFSYLEESKNDYKPYLYVSGVNKNYYNLLKLTEGRFPENENEIVISKHIEDNGGVSYKVGDILNLELGTRVIDNTETLDNRYLNADSNEEEMIVNESLNIKYKKDYTIVGIVERSFTESRSAAGYSVFTLINEENTGNYKVYIEYEQLKDIREKTEIIAKSLGLDLTHMDEVNLNTVSYNEQLLNLIGESKFGNFNDAVISVMTITLALISIACIIVIYNSFAISVMERKKQFGLFSSIGATRKQLKKTVFFEAFIVGIIGITLGLLGALLGIGIVLKIINHLLINEVVLKLDLDLVIYPLFIIIPIIFMIIVLVISAHLPAKRASKISPIEAIRLNDDIKIKSKKLKTSKIITKIFGVEGDLALKSMKRNKKKYRITIVSLFISIVLFISFSSFITYIIGGARISMNIIDYDMNITGNADKTDSEKLYTEIKNITGITNTIMYNATSSTIDIKLSGFYTNEYKKALKEYNEAYQIIEEDRDTVLMLKLDPENYQRIKNDLNIKEDKVILVNSYNLSYYLNNNKKSLTGTKFKNISNMKFNSVLEVYHEEEVVKTNMFHFSDLIELKEIPLSIEEFVSPSYSAVLIVPESIFDSINNKMEETLSSISDVFTRYNDFTTRYNDFTITFNYEDTEEVIKLIDEYKPLDKYLYSFDVKEEEQMLNNMLIVINILVYGFITLVTLIGVTSVFNTINTSMALRKKEFAILRSTGLSPKGFNKILRFETLIFGFKSLLYALPVSFGIIYLIHLSMSELVGFGNFMIPWKSVFLAIVGVFIIVAITMLYATKKIKHENILDAIREENI